MNDEINLSLDEIIQKRKTHHVRFSDGPPQRGTYANGPRVGGGFRGENSAYRRNLRPVVVDVRMKIIKNKRAKLRDARDQLVEMNRGRDARYRLQNRPRPMGSASRVLSPTSTNGRSGGVPDHLKLKRLNRRYAEQMEYIPPMSSPPPPIPHYHLSPGISFRNGNQEQDNPFDHMDVQRMSVNPPIGSLGTATRTLHNDAFTMPCTMPPFPHFRTVRAVSTPMNPNGGSQLLNFTPPTASSDPDPFDQYEVNRRPNLSVPPPPLPDQRPLRGILRTRPNTPPPPTISVAPVPINLSASMRARLERAPNPNMSMGIFAHNVGGDPPMKSYGMHSPSPPSASTPGYRIVVSNLHPSVTQIDIKELFEDIGDLVESRLVRPGVAEVIYRNLKDAEHAVDAYHNRQLDGQPMNCLLVNPRASYKLTATNLKYGW